MSHVDLPDVLARTVQSFGDAGRRWARDLPGLLAELGSRWSVQIGPPFAKGGSVSFVAPAARRDGSQVVVKVPIPHAEAATEPDALAWWGGRGAVHMLAVDASGAMLLERCLPGAHLASLNEPGDVARAGVAVLCRLHRPPPDGHRFETLGDRMDRWAARGRELHERHHGPFDARLLHRGVELMRTLPGDAVAQVILHGDFHHFNILSASREPWLAIDPKPLIGDPAFDTVQFLWNRLDVLGHDRDALAMEVSILASGLGVARHRVLDWCVARLVENALWDLDEGDVQGSRACADAAALFASL